MPSVEESNFVCDVLRDYEKYIINASLEESVIVDPNEDVFAQRFFQNELVDHIQPLNKIIFVPLERDKLHIAVSYLKYLMGRNDGKRVIYVVESATHVIDSLSFFRIHLPSSVTSLTTNISEEAWQEACKKYEVFVVPAYIFDRLQISDVDVLIFSECIFPLQERISKEFVLSKMLVLTSTFNFIGKDSTTFYEWLKELEITFHSSLITSLSCNLVKKYLADSIVKSVKFTPSAEVFHSSENIMLIQNIISELSFVLNCLGEDFHGINSISTMLEYLKNCIGNYGLYPAYIIASLYQIKLEKCRLCTTNQSYLIFSSIISDFNTIRSLLERELSTNNSFHDAKSVLNYSDEKIVKLILLLYRMDFQDNCVIFVRDSEIAHVVTCSLERLANVDLMPNVSVSCVVSSSNDCNTEREEMLREKYKRTAFKKFYKGITNVLVLPWNFPLQSNFVTADWIVYFDLPSNYKDYLISRKYGNAVSNHYFFFISRHNQDEFHEKKTTLEGYLELDAALKEVLERKNLNNMESIFKNFRKTVENTNDLIEQFSPIMTSCGKKLHIFNAVAVLNEFCGQLPGDVFTRSVPRWSIHKQKHGVIGKLQLPIQSFVKTVVQSSPVKNVLHVKNITALEVVKSLYKLGSIDSNLNPTVKNIDRELNDLNLFPYWRDEDDDKLRGSGSSFSVVSLNFPEWLSDSSPKADAPCYLHVINLNPLYVVPASSSRKQFFYDLMRSPFEYGILTRKKLPQVCEFPIYTDLGQVQVRILTNNVVLTPSVEQVAKVYSFHRFVFQDLLNVIKGFLVFDYLNAHSSYCIVPVVPESMYSLILLFRAGSNSLYVAVSGQQMMLESSLMANWKGDGFWTIAWDVIYNLSEKKEVYQPTEQELIRSNYFGPTYHGKVATPWYQAPPHRDYIITNVLTDCTPGSSFSSSDYQSYSEYYYDKYGLEIKQPLQPLLEARSVNTNLNCLRPRAQKPGTQRRRGEKIKDFEETLVPEFCILQPFPAVYWYKSMTLVSVLHRLHFALNAETIRRRLASTATSNSFSEAVIDDQDILVEDSSCINELDDLGKPVVPISSILKEVKLARKIRSYPWSCDQLPQEIDKSICSSSLLDIMAYYDFVTPSMKLLTGEIPASFIQTPIKDREADFSLKFLNIDKNLYPGPKQCDIIQALTARQCNDIVNLERFKIVGNAFLNFAASLMLYKLYPDLNVCQLRNLRHKLIGKRNLYYCGSRMGLGSFLKLQDISTSNDWNVGGFSVPEVLINILKNSEVPPEVIFNVELSREEQASGIIHSKTRINVNENMITYCNERIKSGNVFSAETASSLTENNNHALVYLGKLCVPENAVVNVLKSLIGVYLMNCGVSSTMHVLQKVGLLKQNINLPELFSSINESDILDYQFSGFETVCKRINYKFKSTKLPYLAFVHHSHFPEDYVDCNQRLAFLGGAILDVLITTYVHETCKLRSIDHIVDLRISLANDVLYAVLAVRLGLHSYLMYESPYLMEKIDEFVRKQERANHRLRRDDYLFLIEETSRENSWSIDVPKALSDIIKALIAGIFIDCDGDLKTVWNVCYSIMKNDLEKFAEHVPRNPVRLLLDTDLCVEFGSPSPYENDDSLLETILSIEIDHVKRSFSGVGYSKLHAKIIAAKLALKYLNKDFTL